MNAITTTDAAPFVPGTGLVPRNMDEALRLAEFMSRARTVPKHLQDSPGDCLMVVELAMRWGMSPFAVAQGTSVISGKLMIEGKLVAAAVEASGAITGHIDYAFTGEGDARAITVSATRRGETNPREVIVALKEARTNNEMWKRQPDQQLVYHGVRVWARRWTPAVILGVYSREEMGPIIDGTAETLPEAPQATTDARQAMNDAIPLQHLRSVAAATPRAPRKADPEVWDNPTTAKPGPERKSWSQWAEALELADRDSKDTAAIGRIIAKSEIAEIVRLAQEGEPSPAKTRIVAAFRNLEARYLADPPQPPDGDADLDEVVIKGEEHLAAG
jgi:hypothetical protein